MKKAIITVGISASGKTTWAENFVKSEHDPWVNINRDNIRFKELSLGTNWGDYKFSRGNEDKVTAHAIMQAELFSDAGFNVIISDTNLNPKIRNGWIRKLEELGYDVQIKEFPISIEEAWKRDSLRENGVGHSVIARQYEQWLEYKKLQKTLVYDHEIPDCIIVDIDGTLAHMTDRGPFDWSRVGEDDVDIAVANLIHAMSQQGYNVVLMSGRDSVCRYETSTWLKKHHIHYDHLYMRKEGDIRKDAEVKKELFDKHVRGGYNVLFVVDDRPVVCRMWRELGLKVLQVGNPHIEF